jgi:hypothetical protein
LVALKSTVERKNTMLSGNELAVPGLMSETSLKPVAVKFETNSSKPEATVRARKKSSSSVETRRPGLLLDEPGSRSIKRCVVAVVPSVTHISAPFVDSNAAK